MDWLRLRWVPVYLFPAVPLAGAWYESISSPDARKIAILIPQILATVSLLWIALMFLNQDVLGPSYSTLRFIIIVGNLGMVLATCLFSFVFSFLAKPRWRLIWTGVACLFLLFDWILTGAANAVA